MNDNRNTYRYVLNTTFLIVISGCINALLSVVKIIIILFK